MAITRVETHPPDNILKQFTSGRLDGGADAAVLKHLDQCPECVRRAMSLSGDTFVKKLGRVSIPSRMNSSGGSQEASARSVGGIGEPDHADPDLSAYPQYRIVRELGRGGMGVVYLVRHDAMARNEVLKVVNAELLVRPGAAERFQNEIQAAAQLRHANVVAAHTVLTLPGGGLALAMEYVEGDDLAIIVDRDGPLPIRTACLYARQVAHALQHAFEKGLVHRDIKPANLMLACEGVRGERHVVKVLDFGLAKLLPEVGTNVGDADLNAPSHNLTSTGQMMGTPDYMSPEQWADATRADHRSDMYSLGATLFFLLTGRPPFEAGSLRVLRALHVAVPPIPLVDARRDVPEELDSLVRTLLAKDPADRPQSPGELARLLDKLVRTVKSGKSTLPHQSTSMARSGLAVDGTSFQPAATPRPQPPGLPVAVAHIADRYVVPDVAVYAESYPTPTQNPFHEISESAQGSVYRRPSRSARGRTRASSGLVLFVLATILAASTAGVVVWGSGILVPPDPAGTIVSTEATAPGGPLAPGRPPVAAAARPTPPPPRTRPGAPTSRSTPATTGIAPPPPMTLPTSPSTRPTPTQPPPTAPTAPTDADVGFVPLFNNKDLSGWRETPGATTRWSVLDGTMVGAGTGVAPAGHLIAPGPLFRDGTVRFRGSGIGAALMLRGKEIGNGGYAGYTITVSPAYGDPPGSLYDFSAVGAGYTRLAAAKLPKQFEYRGTNDFEVTITGNRIVVAVNGEQVLDYTDSKRRYASGQIALRSGKSSTMIVKSASVKQADD